LPDRIASAARLLIADSRGAAPKRGHRTTRSPPYDRAAEQETARGINGLALADGLTDPVRFETGSLRAPIATLQACADDLLKVWGLDPEKHKTMTTSAIPNPAPGGVLPQGTIRSPNSANSAAEPTRSAS